MVEKSKYNDLGKVFISIDKNFCIGYFIHLALYLTYFFSVSYLKASQRGWKEFSRKSVMFVLANFIKASAQVMGMALNLYMWIVIIRALLSWVNPDPYNPIVQILYRITDPVLNRIRAWGPFRGMAIDLSPIVVIFAIYFLQTFLVGSLLGLAAELQ
jgi:YggT family protein